MKDFNLAAVDRIEAYETVEHEYVKIKIYSTGSVVFCTLRLKDFRELNEFLSVRV